MRIPAVGAADRGCRAPRRPRPQSVIKVGPKRPLILLVALLFIFVACDKKPNAAGYEPVYDTTAVGGTALDADCSNPQDPQTIPSVTYTTNLTQFGVTVENLELGAINTGGGTTEFRVFAPSATSIEVLFYSSASAAVDAPTSTSALTRDNQSGVWYGTISASAGSLYRYRINCMKNYIGGSPIKEKERYFSDPYARAVAGANGPSIVINKSAAYTWNDVGANAWFGTTTPSRPKTASYIVQQVHVADFTSDTSCSSTQCAHDGITSIAKLTSDSNRGKYAGLKDMLSYFTTLGINAVELMPVNEFAVDSDSPESYSWGYLPVNFFSPESSYASSATNGSAITELRDLINTLHQNGIAVIMDAVWTHTSNRYNMLYRAEPYYRYYFRTNGATWENPGTGNWIDDDKTNKPFAYKMVMDAALYWLKEFHIDGIRFDLAVATRESTLKELQKKLCNPSGAGFCQNHTDSLGNIIFPPNLLTGENWMGATRHGFMVQSATNDTTGATGINFTPAVTGDYPGFSQWNDYFRESVKGFIQGNADPTITSRTKTAVYFSKNRDDGVWQAISKNPVDTLNYIESHDEETVMSAVQGNELKAALGALILLTSHGLPMIQEGQEFFRSKGKQDQSYSGNVLKWGALSANKKMYYLMKYLIDMRKSCPGLQYASDPTNSNSNFDSSTVNQTYSLFTKATSGSCSGSATSQINGRQEFRIIVNMTNTSQTFTVETGGARWCAFVHIADDDGSETTPAATFSVIAPSGTSGLADISGWGYTTTNWTLNAFSAAVLSKISGTGTCASP